MQGWQAKIVLSLSACVALACLKMPSGGGSSDEGSGGSPGTGGHSSSEVPACAALFDGACQEPAYDYYLALCENENAGAVVAMADCFVPDCLTPLDEGTESCIQLAVQDEQDEDVAALLYDLESLCGSQLDNPQVRVVAVHAASINAHERLVALTSCLRGVYCSQIVDCVTDPEVAPWWEG